MGAAEKSVSVVAAMARDGEWLNADACAFLLGMTTPKGEINRRGFLERVAVLGSFPAPPGHRVGEEVAAERRAPVGRRRAEDRRLTAHEFPTPARKPRQCWVLVSLEAASAFAGDVYRVAEVALVKAEPGP